MTASLCKACGAEMVWVTTSAGKNMPLDAKASTMFVLEDVAAGAPPKARAIQVRASHFSTCPAADSFRKIR